jgi:hypothetical protein
MRIAEERLTIRAGEGFGRSLSEVESIGGVASGFECRRGWCWKDLSSGLRISE